MHPDGAAKDFAITPPPHFEIPGSAVGTMESGFPLTCKIPGFKHKFLIKCGEDTLSTDLPHCDP